jgi:cytochrome c
LAIACLSAVCAAAARGAAAPSASRGELLYATHCVSCHDAQVHWRDRRLAKDWTSLVAEVRRWQANAGLGWSDQEIVDVARYLNARYYHFTPPARQAHAGEGVAPRPPGRL